MQHEEQPSEFFLAWGHIILRYRWLMLVVSVALTAVSGWFAQARIKTDMGIDAFSEKKAQTSQILNELRADFGRDDVGSRYRGRCVSQPYLTKLRQLEQAYARLQLDLPSLNASSGTGSEAVAMNDANRLTGDESDEFEDDFEDDE